MMLSGPHRFLWAVAPERIWNWEAPVQSKSGRAPIRSEAPKKTFLGMTLQFLALKAQLVVLVSTFVIVSTVWSVSCLLFFYSRCSPCPVICISGAGARGPVPHGVGATACGDKQISRSRRAEGCATRCSRQCVAQCVKWHRTAVTARDSVPFTFTFEFGCTTVPVVVTYVKWQIYCIY